MAMPGLMENGRWRGLARVSLVTLVQGGAAGAAAFATRGLFEALNARASLPLGLIAVLAASGLVIAGARVLARLMGERLGQDYALSIRLALLEHASGMPASAVAARRSGYMSLRFVGDMTAFRNWLGKGLPRLIAGAVMIPVACAVLWGLEPRFALVVTPLFVVTLGVMAFAGPRLEPLHRRLRARRARIAAEMAERMPLAPELDRMGRRPAELRSLRKRTERMIRAGLQRLFWAETLKALPDAVAGLAACAVIVTGAMAGTGTGTIAGALAAIGLVLTPLRDLASVWNFRAAHLAAQRKCGAALARDQRAIGHGDQRLPGGPLHVCLRDLPMPQGAPLSLEIPAGTRQSLTCDPRDADALFSALCGLEQVPPGHITLSGLCLTELSRGSLRRGVQRIDSMPAVLKGSLRRNLTLGLRQRPSDKKLERIARKAGLGTLLTRLGGLDGALAEGGRNLSTGERSALSLARVLLGTPQLVLLGEALWHLDPEAQGALAAHLDTCGATVLRHPVLAGATHDGPLAAA
ncbi:ABC transporter transmembrane domain-containing protein [Roseovarius tibetensis]|uniref:ABC transporter transmembrane domain-containing protein n=1 Tax=Roseovarius tibetensis TaxID=2685897 RepID=UPI003D7FDC5B